MRVGNFAHEWFLKGGNLVRMQFGQWIEKTFTTKPEMAGEILEIITHCGMDKKTFNRNVVTHLEKMKERKKEEVERYEKLIKDWRSE